MKTRPLLRQKEKLFERIRTRGGGPALSDEDRAEARREFGMLKKQMAEIVDAPDADLFQEREEDFDWMRISAQTVRKFLNIHQLCRKVYDPNEISRTSLAIPHYPCKVQFVLQS